MSTSALPGFSTPRRRPMTPGRRDHVLPSFNSPASIKVGRMLESAFTGANGNVANMSLEDELPGDVADGIAASAVTATSEEYDPPRVWFQRDEDRRQNEEFTRRVDEMVQELKRLVRDRNTEYERRTTEYAERQSRMTADMETLERENSDILSALKEENSSEDALSSTIASLQSKQKQAQDAVDKLVDRRKALQRELDRKLAVIARKKLMLDTQSSKNGPEIEFFEHKMGIAIVGGTTDMLTFVFTRISLSEPLRQFSVTIDLSQREYRATSCKPKLASLESHIEWLNATRDFFGFLKRVRHEFVEHYLNESM
ncbi:kinetochore-associated Ndc80 complex subunit spc25 [Coemansia sp. RSA 1813]|nr:kinetochore-associated Ndc80 complex subunit spc25 [Coemansia sp. RSA 1646]KAJ1773947.1 kinetochore-associated Ndc80 complex subunit spc25 [Coemansia sp. RSA 1843]KAJ2089333.1 kinetochore-associated Ndc80 complex subunit spc25 [Coemansia sp. RSA 986]KAJ2214436.1 kinetochore-associated Ndc80 complex subunit spc25 [Coemansia sp. RSA 487]KAJ2569343.1 kinetochore-associated Ndc80 complex subunit spc25 [Coemansia sp. RSA 1813]